MEKNRIYKEKTVHDFRTLVSSCAREYGNRTAFTIKDKEKKLHDISFIDFENNIKELGDVKALLSDKISSKEVAKVIAQALCD